MLRVIFNWLVGQYLVGNQSIEENPTKKTPIASNETMGSKTSYNLTITLRGYLKSGSVTFHLRFLHEEVPLQRRADSYPSPLEKNYLLAAHHR